MLTSDLWLSATPPSPNIEPPKPTLNSSLQDNIQQLLLKLALQVLYRLGLSPCVISVPEKYQKLIG